MSESDARFWIRNFIESKGDSALASMGFLPSDDAKEEGGLAELASTSRLNLIIDQNVRMARGARRYREMLDEKDVAPYVVYRTRDDGRVRNSHAILNGLVYRVDDPELKRIMPPQDFRCRCRLVQITEEELGERRVQDGLPDGWEPPKSGYSFDPEKWSAQAQESRDTWENDLKDNYLEDTAIHAGPELQFLSDRRKFWERKAEEAPETAREAIAGIDARIEEIRKQRKRNSDTVREVAEIAEGKEKKVSFKSAFKYLESNPQIQSATGDIVTWRDRLFQKYAIGEGKKEGKDRRRPEFISMAVDAVKNGQAWKKRTKGGQNYQMHYVRKYGDMGVAVFVNYTGKFINGFQYIPWKRIGKIITGGERLK
jgi:SPP1 gp7 family putative phage head morphogenesis protein